ncbi:hypothetical protein NDU88_003457 [Pleurodeles waltl]|uniref:Tf2-1-like SH3-like domain-containing protein n=1 Tax=Pleurodeles waltl TaxID=8319 RepID=A0AAV7L1W3_PLEWA|nr:hypothetical protein NDU88_003457 [Pleurodeles waltl]
MCDGSLRSDPHTSLTCADSATHDLVHTLDSDALIGHLRQPRDQLRVKNGASGIPGRVVSGSESIRDPVTKEEQEDEEHGIEEEDGRKTGAEEPRRKPGDRWPGEPAPKPPRFRRSVAAPGTETREGNGGGRKSVAEDGRDWEKKLPLVLYAIRTHIQTSLGHSPFEMLFGRPPRTLLDMLVEQWEERDEDIRDLLTYTKDLKENLQSVWDRAHENLREAQDRQKKNYDARSVIRTLNVVDKALILLPSCENKLLARWQGPYEVLERINPTTYRLALPHRPPKKTNLSHKLV